MVRALPGWTAATAGEGAWLTGLTALPPLLGMAWMLLALLRRAPEGEGLAGAYRAAFGPLLGRVVLMIYMVWALFLLSLEGRLYGERMLSAGYRGSPAVFLAVLLALVLWMGRRKLSAFVRAAEIFYLILSLALGGVLLFSILDLTPEYVLPVWTGDLPGVLSATLVPLGVAAVWVYGAFLGGAVSWRRGDLSRGGRWLAAACLVMALLQFGVLAQLGPGLSAQLEEPFFEVARGVGVAGAFQRVESVVVALWLLSDLCLLGLLVFALRALVGAAFGRRAERYCAPVSAVLAFLGALFLFRDGFQAKTLAQLLAPAGNLILGFLVPAAALLVLRLRRGSG